MRAQFRYDKPKEELPLIPFNTYFVSFSPDGCLLACGRCATGHIWNVASREKIWSYDPEGGDFQVIVFSPDGKMFVSASKRQLVIWDVASRKRVGSIPVSATVFQFSPDGKLLAVGEIGYNGKPDLLSFWDVSTRKKLRTARASYPGAFSDLSAVAFSPDGKRLAWAEKMNHSVHLLDVATGEECATSQGGQGILNCLAFSPDGKTLALGDSNHAIYLWDLPSVKVRKTLADVKRRAVTGLAFSPDGRRLVAAAGELDFWDPRTGKKIRPGNDDEPLKGGGAVFFSPAGHFMITEVESEAVYIRDAKTGEVLRRFLAPDFITALALSPNGKLLAAGADDRTLPIWDLDTSKEVMRLSGDRGQRQAIAFSPDSMFLAVGGEGKIIRVWELTSGKICLQLSSPDDVHCLAFSPDGRFLASSGKDTAVSLWELATGKRVARLTGHQGSVSAIAFSPDGTTLATASEDTTALLWQWREVILRRDKPLSSLSSRDLQRYWKDLASQDARIAYRAIWTLAAVPEQAVSLIQEHIKAIAAPDVSRIARLITNLNSDNFAERNQAMRELESLGELVEPQLRKAMAENVSAETRRRAKELVNRLEKPLAVPEKLRCLRALTVLEQSNTAESIRILKDLAAGAPGARLTREAQAAFNRLEKRKETR
ncbi:MAG TPA: hypothetical protein VH575_21700 [Gemmataceae bacterium]|jgi:WD40 repeat protein